MQRLRSPALALTLLVAMLTLIVAASSFSLVSAQRRRDPRLFSHAHEHHLHESELNSDHYTMFDEEGDLPYALRV